MTEETFSSKRKATLLHEGFAYRLAYTSQGGQERWRCIQSTCSGVIYRQGGEVLMMGRKDHCHPGSQAKNEVRVSYVLSYMPCGHLKKNIHDN